MKSHNFYRDMQGRILRDDETNLHHLMYEKNRYRDVQLQQFRGLGGFLLRMTLPSHHDLHDYSRETIGMPIVPCKNLRNELIRLQFPERDKNDYDRFYMSLDRLDQLAIRKGYGNEVTREAGQLLDNLLEQKMFIELGRVALLPQEETNE